MNIPKDQKSLKALLDRRHPDYKKKLDHWDFMIDTYEGSKDWFEKHLFQFNREGSETYEGRKKRAYRFNHTREVVDLVNKYLFKQPAKRSDNPSAWLKKFRERATLSGLSIADFEAQVGKAASIFGRVYVVVDSTIDTSEVLSIADARNSKGQLYAYIVYPQDFLDCGYDELGQYNWVLLREKYRDDSDPFSADEGVGFRYRLWTKTHWALFTEDRRGRVAALEWREHSLGCVPVLKCDHIESDAKYSAPALIENICYMDRAVANYLSNLDQIINDQTFSQLVMPAQGVLNGMPAPNAKDPDDPDNAAQRRHIQKLGTSQILLYDGEHGGKPEYINPDPRQAHLILSVVKQIINEIYHTVGLAGERTKQDNAVGIDNSSGVAKAFDFERVASLLSAKADAMQSFANKLETLVEIYGGQDWELTDSSEPTVLYPTNFDVRSLIEDMAMANEFALMSAPMEIRREHMRELIRKFWPLASEEKIKKLDKAIDEWDESLKILTTDYAGSKDDGKLDDGKPGQGAVGGKKAASTAGKVN